MRILGTAVKLGLELMKVGALTSMNQYTNEKMRKNANHLIGEVERGTTHVGRKLKIIKD